jgi:polyisoprenoid-binding protein YceI
MSQTEGQFLTIPTSVNGNSTGFLRIYTESLETISDQIADKIKKTYLETEKYPEISFNLKQLEGESNSVLLSHESRFKASGTLNLHGVGKEIVFYPHIFLNDDVIEFKGETVIRLTDFGIKVPHFLFLEVQDEISIHFNVTWDYSPHLRAAAAEVSQ